MELREALTQISEIRRQVARTEVFRGYRALPVAFSGILALAVAGFQQVWLPEPDQQCAAYLAPWVGAALVSMLATGIEMVLHYRRLGSSLTRETTWLAVEQFLPCVVAGGLLTFALVGHARTACGCCRACGRCSSAWASSPRIACCPRPTFWVGVFYLCAGTLCLTLGPAALSPWAMGVPFGVGPAASRRRCFTGPWNGAMAN